jgi:hypothetical protein
MKASPKPRGGWLAGVAALVLAVLAGAWLTGHVAAAAGTTIDLTVASEVSIGQDLSVSARLTSGGAPVTSRRVSILLDGVTVRSVGVDPNGVAAVTIKGKNLAAAHTATISAVFAGGAELSPSQASAAVVVRPATLTIRTVPATDNVKISVASSVAVTQKGVAVFRIAKLGSYHVTPVISSSNDATRMDFVRWGDNVYTVERDVVIEGDKELDLGLHVAYRGSFRFMDDARATLSPGGIQSVLLTSTGGSQLTLTRFNDVWLEAGTAVKRGEGLGVTTREWRVLEVRMAGANVVNRGQQQIIPGPNAVWTVEVLLFDLRVTAQDAIFGSALTGQLQLAYPDGTTSGVHLDGSHPADFARLPRGDYVLRLSAAGLGAPTPVTLSRDQTSVIRVITYLDLAIFGGFMLACAAALIWLGRRSQILVVARRSRAWFSSPPRAVSGRRRTKGSPVPQTAPVPEFVARFASNARAWMKRSYAFGAMTWLSYREEARVLGMGLRLAPAQLDAWAFRQVFGLLVVMGRILQLLRALAGWVALNVGRGSNAARRHAQNLSGWLGIGSPARQPARTSLLNPSLLRATSHTPVAPDSSGVRTPVSVGASVRRPVPLPGPAPGPVSGPVPGSVPQRVPSPTIAQTIPQTFERSVPGTMKRLVGSRYRAELLPQTQKGRCPNCDRPVPWQAAYCAGCGSRLPLVGPPA